MRCNVPTDNAEDYWRISIFNPYIDHILTDLSSRFADVKETFAPLSSLLPQRIEQLLVVDAVKLYHTYENDFECPNKEAFLCEIQRWKLKWISINKKDRPADVFSTLLVCPKQFFPHIHLLLYIFASIPVTSATAERSFSTLKRIKTYLRSTMGQVRLCGLAHLSINSDVSVSVNEVLDVFSQKKRRLNFAL
jgi:hypothetical protein